MRQRGKQERPSRAGRRSAALADERGTAFAEFALILPVLIIIIFGIFEFGTAFNRAQAVEAAAREGARLGSISTTTIADITTRVNTALVGIPMDNVVNVAVPTGDCNGREGETVVVQVSTLHNIDIPLLGALGPVNLTGEAIFRCEA